LVVEEAIESHISLETIITRCEVHLAASEESRTSNNIKNEECRLPGFCAV
jgi:hypothetical protein